MQDITVVTYAAFGIQEIRNGFSKLVFEKWKLLYIHNPTFQMVKRVEYPVSFHGATGVLTKITNGTILPAKVSLLSGLFDYN